MQGEAGPAGLNGQSGPTGPVVSTDIMDRQCVRVCTCGRKCVYIGERACVRVCVCACMRACVCVSVRACSTNCTSKYIHTCTLLVVSCALLKTCHAVSICTWVWSFVDIL